MGRTKRRKTAFEMVYIPKRVVDGFFFLSFSFLVLVFGFGFTVALLAWRVVFFFFGWGLGWVGLGFIIQHRENLPSTGPTGTCYLFFLSMRWKGMGGRTASGRFLLEIENRQKSATVGLGGGFVFYEGGW